MSKSEAILQSWVTKLESKDLNGLLSLYHKKAILQPTFSENTLTTVSERKDYFSKLTKERELRGVELVDVNHCSQPGGKIDVHTGYCLFHFKEGSIKARFSIHIDPAITQPILFHVSNKV